MIQKTITVDQALALAKSHAEKGDVEKAQQLYSMILASSPQNKKAKKGLKRLQNNTAKNIQPDLTQPQIDYLITLYSSGNLKEAMNVAKLLSQAHPDVPFLHNVLGACYFGLGQLNAAVKSHERALEIKPDYAEAHDNLGKVLNALGQSDAAVACFKRALEIRPDLVEAHNNLGLTLRHLGHLDAAAASFERALAIKPDYARAHNSLSFLKKYEPDDAQIGLMESLYSDPTSHSSDRAHLCFALAKAYEDLGEYDKSFGYLNEGNRLYKQTLNYNIAQDMRIFSITKEIFSAESISFGAAQIDKHSAIKPIFIVGMPRSGTSLVEQILASHTKVYGAGELEAISKLLEPIFLKFFRQVAGQQNGSLSQNDIETVRNGYLEVLNALKVSEKVITDKMPLNFRWIGFILSALPEAKIINLNRDPRATCWSIYKHYFSSKGNGYAYDMEDLAKYYKLYIDLMSFWREHFPNKIYDICYEDLTENQEEETRKLLKFCNLEWEDNCLDFHKTKRTVKTASSSQVRQKIYTGSSEAWKKYEAHLQPLIKSLGY